MTLFDPASLDDALLAHEHELERALDASSLERRLREARGEDGDDPTEDGPEAAVILEAEPADAAGTVPGVEPAPEAPAAREPEGAPEASAAPEVEPAPEAPAAREPESVPEASAAPEVEPAPEAPVAREPESAPEASAAPEVEPDPEEPVGASGDGSLELAPAPLRPALERRGFSGLTAVQRAVLDASTEGRDLRISSQTGSGKTVALGFALADSLEAPDTGRGPVVLVVVPTRELAQQVSRELSWLYEDLDGVEVGSVVGGGSYTRDQRLLRSGPRVLVGTPGRLGDHLRGGRLDLSGLRGLVLDEADQMLDLGFREELEALVEATPASRRTHLVSATFPEAVLELCERYQQEALHVEGTRLGDANEDIDHRAHLVHAGDRRGALVNLLLEAGEVRTLVFVERRSDTVELASRLVEEGFDAHPLSGELAQSQRERTLAAFCAAPGGVLVATDVAARGLDLPDVRLVVHTAPPLDAETYTHRSGRTGRAGQRGSSVMLVAPSRRRRVTRLLAEAGVELRWAPLPGPEELERLLADRRREELVAALEAEDGDPTRRALARELLEGRDPELVVAGLLTRLEPARGARPHAVEALEVRGERGDRPRRDARPDRERRGARDGARGGPGSDGPRGPRRGPRGEGARGGHGAAVEPGYVRFFMNRGASHGASPGRVLAVVCRRGGISGDEVGSIAVHPNGTTFDVRAEVARSFEDRASRTDRRDPGTRIRRDRGPLPPGRGPERR